MDYQKTGRLIAGARKELGLTQEQLAQKLAVSNRTVSKWETGAGFPDISLLEPLGKALDLSVVELLHGERGEEVKTMTVEEAVTELGREEGQKKRRTDFLWKIAIVAAFLALCVFNGAVYTYLGQWKAIVGVFGFIECVLAAMAALMMISAVAFKRVWLWEALFVPAVIVWLMQFGPLAGMFMLGGYYHYLEFALFQGLMIAAGCCALHAMWGLLRNAK